MIRLLRLREVLRKRACGRSTHYSHVNLGLFTPPIKTSARCAAWPEYEVEDIIYAQIRGDSVGEIKALVSKLVSERALLPNSHRRFSAQSKPDHDPTGTQAAIGLRDSSTIAQVMP